MQQEAPMPNFSLTDDVFQQAAEAFPTPFHLYDEAGIRRRAQNLKQAFAWCPDFEEYFAVKALPNPAILRILRSEGCGLDCSSETELMLAEATGFRGRDIMFSANAMPPKEFRHARALDAIINLDDITHIPLLAACGPIPETVCCRFNPGGDFRIGTEIMGNPGEAKYGFTRAQLAEGLRTLRNLGARRFGLHAFLSSNNTDNAYYPTLAALLFRTARELEEETGLPLAFVNLSGGIGIPYRPDQEATDIFQVGEGVRQAYRREFPQGGVAIKTELGRWMTGPNGWLVSHAIHHKDTYRRYIGLD
ncbi:MAG: diaminopimelate decarboxylase, partial [Lachnospiraceae bacterium]|nr:diaminopimelate decarboxylase [Lachnospiraceae bacterium]